MHDPEDHIAYLIDRFLEAEKWLQGIPRWVQPDSSQEWRVRWPLLVGDSISEGFLCLTAYPHLSELRFSITLCYRSCVERLDFIPEYEWHDNPADRGRLLGEYRVWGPHHHAWDDNLHLATAATLPRELTCARKLPKQIRRWEQAFRWFCDRANIRFEPGQMIELPVSETLI